jgi:hypothetical protein
MADWDVTTAGAEFQFFDGGVDNSSDPSITNIDVNHCLIAYGSKTNGYGQVITINTSTWAITTAAAAHEHDNTRGLGNHLASEGIDDNHFVGVYQTTSAYFGVVVFEVNTSTWAVTSPGAASEIMATVDPAIEQIDTNHFLAAFPGTGTDGYVEVVEVNTSTWAATLKGELEHDTTKGVRQRLAMIDDNHAAVVYGGTLDSDSWVQVIEIDTSTWAVSTASAVFELADSITEVNGGIKKVDDNHAIATHRTDSGATGSVSILAFNTSTWAVSTASTLVFDTQSYARGEMTTVDENHFLFVWAGGASAYLQAQVFEVNTSTWAVTTAGARVEVNAVVPGWLKLSGLDTDDEHYVVVWEEAARYGKAQVLAVEVPGGEPPTGIASKRLKIGHGA